MGKKVLIYLTPMGIVFALIATMNSRILKEDLAFDIALKIPWVIELGLIAVAAASVLISIFVEKIKDPALVVGALLAAVILYGVIEKATEGADSIGLWTVGGTVIVCLICYYLALLGSTATPMFYGLIGVAGSMEVYAYLYTWFKKTPDNDLHYITTDVKIEHILGLAIVWIIAYVVETFFQKLVMLKNFLSLLIAAYFMFWLSALMPMKLFRAVFFIVPIACIGYIIGEINSYMAIEISLPTE